MCAIELFCRQKLAHCVVMLICCVTTEFQSTQQVEAVNKCCYSSTPGEGLLLSCVVWIMGVLPPHWNDPCLDVVREESLKKKNK